MSNITLKVDDDVIRKVRKIAVDRNTTLTAIVREYLDNLAERDTNARERTAVKLETSFVKVERDMGKRTWTRDTLYD